ncbi:hypothetical protein CR513_31891, partial [Mucuna pruriens]
MEISFYIDGIMENPLWSRWKSLNIHKFEAKYPTGRLHHLILKALVNMSQGKEESLRCFMECYATISIKIRDLNTEVAIKPNLFSNSLCNEGVLNLRDRIEELIQDGHLCRSNLLDVDGQNFLEANQKEIGGICRCNKLGRSIEGVTKSYIFSSDIMLNPEKYKTRINARDYDRNEDSNKRERGVETDRENEESKTFRLVAQETIKHSYGMSSERELSLT